MSIKRVGFACKVMDANRDQPKKALKEYEQSFSEKTTTIKWLSTQPLAVAEARLWEIMTHNTRAVYNLVDFVGHLPPEQRMVRIGSDQLPGYTHPAWKFFYQQSDVQHFLARHFALAGARARELDVRLSMHPGQFVVLASATADIVARSIEEFEYHADIIRWMGFGRAFQDFKCNVHIAGKAGPEGIKQALKRLSPEACNTITIENDEMSWGLEASLELEQHLALVLDIHHHWIKDEEYIQPQDDRIKRIIASWRGVRPVIHYSVTPQELLPQQAADRRPDIQALLTQGYKKSQLRQHSDRMWNTACNQWAGSFRNDFDIMVEAKHKNLASICFEKETSQVNS